MSVHLILGGARSGKSRRAEALAMAVNKPVTYVATAQHRPEDAEWQARIAKHREDRPKHWQTVEESHAVADIILAASAEQCVVVDCLTLWLSHILCEQGDMEAAQAQLCQALEHAVADVFLVSNEVGMGLVPEHTLGRTFRDAQGRLNQAVAAVADRAEFVVAGLPLRLK